MGDSGGITRPTGIHPTAVVGEPPEHRDWNVGDPYFQPRIDPTARVNAFATIDGGMFRPTTVGERTFVMASVHVGHDAIVGRDCEIAPLASIGGECVIGNNVKIGQGAVFRPRVRVGNGAVIGAGAVVVKDVPAGETWVGSPAMEITEARRQRLALSMLEMEPWQDWWRNRASEVGPG